MKMKRLLGASLAAVGVVAGAVAPAMAEGSFTLEKVSFDKYTNNESQSWIDKNLDATNGYVQFNDCYRRDGDTNFSFDIGVYKEDFGPDTEVGREWIQCVKGSSQTSDRVYSGDHGSDEYHFTYLDTRDINSNHGDGATITKITVAY